MIKPHARLRVETLVALVGVEATRALCQIVGGHRVPRHDQFRTWEQRVRLVHDWLQGGYTQRDLAAKYGVGHRGEEDHPGLRAEAARGPAGRTAGGLAIDSMNATAANAEAGTDSSDSVAPVDQRSNARLAALLDQFRRHPWPLKATFSARLAVLERLLQEHFNRLPNPAFTPRVEMALRLSLDDLALILPPTEQRLLAHLRARKPLRALDRTPGFHTASRRNERLQRLLSRVQVYCGSAVRHRLMQRYDRPGREHRLRVRRRLLSPGRFRPLRLWVPSWFYRV